MYTFAFSIDRVAGRLWNDGILEGPMKDTLVLIESNTSGTGRHFVAAARALGLEPVLFAEDLSRYPYVQEDAVRVVRQSCVGDLDAIDARIDVLARESRIAGIYTSSEYFLDVAADLARRRGLPGADPAAIRTCRDKWKQRLALQAAGVQMPAFALAHTPDEALQALDVLPLPVVVKPTQGTGSSGVRLCLRRSDVETHAASLLAIRANERGMPVPQEVLIEEYVSWPEFSAELFNLELLGVTRKHVSPEPYFVEVGHDFPVVLNGAVPNGAAPADAGESIADALRRALRAVDLCWGPAHVEFRWTGDRYALMEINPRLAGGFIPELVRIATGVDAIAATIAQATGRAPEIRQTKHDHASIRFICPRLEGRIEAFRGLEQAASLDGVVDVRMYRKPHERFVIHHDFRDRIGHVVARGENERAAREAAVAAQALIEVHLTDAN